MTHRPTIENLQKAFGGKVMVSSKRSPYKTLYVWRITDTLCKPFLKALYPHLVTKKYEAWLALEYESQKTYVLNKKLKLSDEEIAIRDGYYWALRAAKKEASLVV